MVSYYSDRREEARLTRSSSGAHRHRDLSSAFSPTDALGRRSLGSPAALSARSPYSRLLKNSRPSRPILRDGRRRRHPQDDELGISTACLTLRRPVGPSRRVLAAAIGFFSMLLGPPQGFALRHAPRFFFPPALGFATRPIRRRSAFAAFRPPSSSSTSPPPLTPKIS